MDNTELKRYGAFFLPRSLWPREPLNPVLRYIERYRGARAGEQTVHDFAELTCTIEGSGCIEIPGKKIELEPGTIVLIPPGVGHGETGAQNLDTVWIGFDSANPRAIPEDVSVIRSEKIAELAAEAWRCAYTGKRLCGPELDGQVLTILGMFLRLLSTELPDDSWNSLLAHLHENYAENIDIPLLAERAGCSESYFYRRFRRLTGCTPVEYITNLRMRRAMVYLLKTRLTLAEVAKLCGFSDPFYFSKTFRRHTGMSPSEFRKNKVISDEKCT